MRVTFPGKSENLGAVPPTCFAQVSSLIFNATQE